MQPISSCGLSSIEIDRQTKMWCFVCCFSWQATEFKRPKGEALQGHLLHCAKALCLSTPFGLVLFCANNEWYGCCLGSMHYRLHNQFCGMPLPTVFPISSSMSSSIGRQCCSYAGYEKHPPPCPRGKQSCCR